jgi:hypothetical protein
VSVGLLSKVHEAEMTAAEVVVGFVVDAAKKNDYFV